MLTQDLREKIEKLIYQKPRSMQEIAQHIGKNWRTADRYVDEIEKEYGTIATRVFRGGTRGALKIAYWASIEKASRNIFQEELEKQIIEAKKKDEFAGFDIFQHVADKEKKAWIKEGRNEIEAGRLEEFQEVLLHAKKQIIFFSGNLSFINFRDAKVDVFKVLEKLVQKGVMIKVLCRVDIAGRPNVEKLLSLNYKYGKEMIEIRHREHGIRATVIDNTIVNIKEEKEPTGREKELAKKIFIFYTITDKEWIEWVTKIFWKLFNASIDAKKRIYEIDKLKSQRRLY